MFRIEHLAAHEILYAHPLGFSNAKLELPILLQFGKIIAEFFLDRRSHPHRYRYTLTRHDGPEILHWGEEVSEQQAHASAKMAAHHFITRTDDAT